MKTCLHPHAIVILAHPFLKYILGSLLALSLAIGAFAQSINGRGSNSQSSPEFNLPLVITQFNASLNNNKVKLDWITGKEKALSHFVVERSTDGVAYSEVGIVVAKGNTNVKTEYSFFDNPNPNAKGVILYRIKMIDMDGYYQRSAVRIIRLGGQKETVSLVTYPNPVVNELRVTLPASWQDKPVTYDLYTMNGQVIKHLANNKAGQTEILNVTDISAGLYMVKVSTGTESAVQRIIKSK